MKRNQTFHETLIPLLVEGIGAESYLEFGTHLNETIGKVRCARRFGVDRTAVEPIWNTTPELNPIKFFKMTTQDFIKTRAPHLAPFDFVFIDANHSAKAVEEDFFGIWPHVSEEGIVCLHDTNPATPQDTDPGFCGDAWKFAMDLRMLHDAESVTLPYHPGLTIIRKRIRWGPE